jgi:DNA-binding Lrp family transcriptional regulator
MMRQPLSLRPHDVCVLLQFALSPEVTFRELAECVGLSLGEAHNATKRLEVARLVSSSGGIINRTACIEFLVSGVQYVFPGILGPEVRGVPTAHCGPVLRDRLQPGDMVVWPSAKGDARGFLLVPLCQGAPDTATTNPSLYSWLTVVDAIRIGRARERKLAREYLEEELPGTLSGPS